jgi:hypothetical protein
MRLAASLACYAIGVLVSETILRLGWGYSLYNKLMLLSSDLDDKGRIWKDV